MTVGVLLLTLAGLLLSGGLVAAVAAVRGVSVLPAGSPSARGSRPPRITRLHLGALATGVLILLFTGWPVAALAGAGGVVFIPKVLGGGKASKRMIATSEALADWTRRLADLVSSGAAGSTRDALRRSLSSAPEAIAPAVTNLVTRMGPQGVEPALRQFAREVDDPAADKIAMVLILRSATAGRGWPRCSPRWPRTSTTAPAWSARWRPSAPSRGRTCAPSSWSPWSWSSGWCCSPGPSCRATRHPWGRSPCCWTSRSSGRRCGGCAGCPTRPGHRVCSSTPTWLRWTGDRAADGRPRRDADRARPGPRRARPASRAAVADRSARAALGESHSGRLRHHAVELRGGAADLAAVRGGPHGR